MGGRGRPLSAGLTGCRGAVRTRPGLSLFRPGVVERDRHGLVLALDGQERGLVPEGLVRRAGAGVTGADSV